MAIFIWPRTPIDTTGLATEATQLLVEANTAATVTELQSANTELQTLNAKDFATETTLASLEAKDFATETTLASLEAKDFATESTLSSLDSKDFATETTLVSAVQALDTVVANTARAAVAFQADSILIDTSSTNIPASSSLPLEIVSSTGSEVIKIQTVEDIGEYIGLFIGPASSESLAAVLPLGGGEVEVNIGSSVRISLRALENTAISTGKIAINFLSPQ